ncbi:uncharacterized protein LOC142612283 [Castanea sativa]|uniref:uncharacterized protein LOC142612283 n=1 Tax=Castanea sativa TaxID=21020 RepID=UPI003F64E49A
MRAFDIKYMPRTSIKGQVLVDLVADFAEPLLEKEGEKQNMDEKSVGMISLQEPLSYRVYVNGAANQRGSGARLVLVSLEGIVIEKSLRLGFSASNNGAEYEALLVGMTMVKKMGGRTVEAFSDSRLVVGQVEGELEAKDLRMQEYLSQVRHLQSGFKSFTLQKIAKSRNTHANSLDTLVTSSAQGLPKVILVEDLCKFVEIRRERAQIHQVKVGPSWMDPIVLFLKNDILLEEKGEADKVRKKSPRFLLSENQKLYKCSFSGPYLLCVHLEAIEPLLEELHEEICGSHIEGRSLSHRAFTQGYWWSAGNRKWLLVGIDYFTKWVEVEPLANIRDVDAKKFVWTSIITRFGIPRTLISYNGLQFDSKAFRKYCYELGIKNRSTGETSFSLTYGAEAVISLDTGFSTLRTSLFAPDSNDGLLERSLDLIEERREYAMV